MKGHFTRKELIELVAGTAGARLLGEWERHGKECPRCREKYDRYASLVKPRYRDVPFRQGDVKARITARWEAINADDGNSPGKETARPRKRPLVPAFVLGAFVVLFALFLYIWKGPDFSGERGVVSLSVLQGNVLVDGNVLTGRTSVAGGSSIILGNGAGAELAITGSFRILLKGDTSFHVLTAQVSPQGKPGRMEFELRKGELVSEFPHGKEHISYSYTTPQCRIESLGTKFILTAGIEETALVMYDGEVRLISLQTGEQITARSGRSYRVGRSISTLLTEMKHAGHKRLHKKSGGKSVTRNMQNTVENTGLHSGTTTGDTNKQPDENASRTIRRDQKEMNESARELRREKREMREVRSGQRNMRNGR